MSPTKMVRKEIGPTLLIFEWNSILPTLTYFSFPLHMTCPTNSTDDTGRREKTDIDVTGPKDKTLRLFWRPLVFTGILVFRLLGVRLISS